MEYTSTRNKQVKISCAKAILAGISEDGGLFVPEDCPQVSASELSSLVGLSYEESACRILSLFLTDFSKEELRSSVENAYGKAKDAVSEKFDLPGKIGMSRIDPQTYLLELWHGPTCAFKDMALQLLPQLLPLAAQKVPEAAEEAVILVATSGDTGKAALEGFRDVAGTKLMVFYPKGGVSPLQERQMSTQEGENLCVAAIEGNFDDAQSAVKQILGDSLLRAELQAQNKAFSSANSINWGRLVPQIVYYFVAYARLCEEGEILAGEKINFSIPTGNFGNILAAYYAKQMGLPVNKLICASNENNILTDFLESGCYDRRRPFYQTISPSMDILISSNLERLLFALNGHNDRELSGWMSSLKNAGKYIITKDLFQQLQEEFVGGSCDERQTRAVIRKLFESCGYLCDPHTAVALHVWEAYRQTSGEKTKTIVVSTASPFKFPHSVLEALGEGAEEDPFAAMQQLSKRSGCAIPAALSSLQGQRIRFERVVEKEKMREFVQERLTAAAIIQKD